MLPRNESVSTPSATTARACAPRRSRNGGALSSLRAPARSGTATARSRRLCRPAGSAVASSATPRSRQASLTRARKVRMLLSQTPSFVGVERDPRREAAPAATRFQGRRRRQARSAIPIVRQAESGGHRSRPGQSRLGSSGPARLARDLGACVQVPEPALGSVAKEVAQLDVEHPERLEQTRVLERPRVHRIEPDVVG